MFSGSRPVYECLSQLNMDPSQIERTGSREAREKRRRRIFICMQYFSQSSFFNRIKHLNVKQKCNKSAEKIRKAAQQVQHLYQINLFAT